MKKLKNTVFILLITGVLLSLLNMDIFADERAFAKVSKIKGEANVIKASGGKPVKIFKNMKISQGDKIITTKDAQVRILFENKTLLIIEGNSEVLLKKNVNKENKKGYERLLEINKGSVVVDVDKKLKKDDKLEIKTPTMVAGVRGTSFGIVQKEREFYIEVYRGVVELAPNKEKWTTEQQNFDLKPIFVTRNEHLTFRTQNFLEDYKNRGYAQDYQFVYPNILLRFERDDDYYENLSSEFNPFSHDFQEFNDFDDDHERGAKKIYNMSKSDNDDDDDDDDDLFEMMEERKNKHFGEHFSFYAGYSSQESEDHDDYREKLSQNPNYGKGDGQGSPNVNPNANPNSGTNTWDEDEDEDEDENENTYPGGPLIPGTSG